MKKDISVIVSFGPGVYDSEQLKMYKYATIGIKWNPEMTQPTSIEEEEEFLNSMVAKVKDEFIKASKNILDESLTGIDKKFEHLKNETGLIMLTDQFFEYLKTHDTKIEAIRVSLNNYEADYKEHKIKTFKASTIAFTADDQSMEDMFSNLVKELYYEYGDTVIDIYSIILTPKIYKIVNNIPIEYRGLLVRVKK